MGQLNLAFWAWIESIRGMKARGPWLPFLIIAAVQVLGLWLLTEFYRPALSWLLAPLIKAISGPLALHYPQFFLALPTIFSQGNLFLDWIVGSFIYGMAYLVMWRAAVGQPTGGSATSTWSKYLHLLIARLPALLIYLVLFLVIPRAWNTGDLAGNALRAARIGTFLITMLVEALLVYAPLFILVRGRSVAEAWGDSVRLAARTPVATGLIVLVPNLIQVPLSLIMRRADQVLRALTPEMVAWLVLISIVLYVLINYIVIASAVRVFRSRAAELPGGAR